MFFNTLSIDIAIKNKKSILNLAKEILRAAGRVC